MRGGGDSTLAIVSPLGALAPGGRPDAALPSALEPSDGSGFAEAVTPFDACAMWNQAQQGAWELAAGDADTFAAVPFGRSDP